MKKTPLCFGIWFALFCPFTAYGWDDRIASSALHCLVKNISVASAKTTTTNKLFKLTVTVHLTTDAKTSFLIERDSLYNALNGMHIFDSSNNIWTIDDPDAGKLVDFIPGASPSIIKIVGGKTNIVTVNLFSLGSPLSIVNDVLVGVGKRPNLPSEGTISLFTPVREKSGRNPGREIVLRGYSHVRIEVTEK
jgi:hypothetical protein